MSVHQLGIIEFEKQRDYGGDIGLYPPSLPWNLQFLYDDETDNRSAVINGLVAISVDTLPKKIYLFSGSNTYATLQTSDFKYCRGTSLDYYLQNVAEPETDAQGNIFRTVDFPYWKLLSIPNHYECADHVCDIQFQGEPKVKVASGQLIPDGEIQVNATSSKPNVQYAIDKINNLDDQTNVQNLQFQTSNLFAQLFPGLYRIYARDKHDCLTQVNVNVGYKAEGYVNTRLYFEFSDPYNQTYRVNIVERDNSGQTEEVKAGSPPLTIKWEHNDNIFRRIIGSGMVMNLVNESHFQFLNLFDKEDKYYRADLIKDPTGANQLLWSGFLLTEQYSEPFQDPPYVSTITFNDGLGELKDIDYLNSAGEMITGSISRFEMLLIILRKLDIPFNVRIIADLESKTETFDKATQTPLHIDYLDQEGFSENNCDQVLKDLLFRYNARIHMKDGYFWIQRIFDNVRPFDYLEYDLDGNFIEKKNVNNYKLLEKPSPTEDKNFYVEDFPTLRLQTGVKRVNLQRPSHARNNVLINGDFENTEVLISSGLGVYRINGWTPHTSGNVYTRIESFNPLDDGRDDFVLRVKGNSKDSRVFSKSLSVATFNRDRIKFSFKYFLGLNDKMPAAKVKWRVEWGNNYLTKTGTWVRQHYVNTMHEKSFESWKTFSIDTISPDVFNTGIQGLLTVTIWSADFYPDKSSNRFFTLATQHEEAMKKYETDYRNWLSVLEDEGQPSAGVPPVQPTEPVGKAGYIPVADYPDDYILVVEYDYVINVNSGATVKENSYWEIEILTIEASSETPSNEIRYWKNIGKLRANQAGIPRTIQVGANPDFLETVTTFRDPFIDLNDVKFNIYPNGRELEEEIITTKDNKLNFYPEYTEEFITGSLPKRTENINPTFFKERDRWLYDYFAKNAQGNPIFMFKRSTSTQFQIMEQLICNEILSTYEKNYWILDAIIRSKEILNFTNAIVDLIYPVTEVSTNVFEGKIYLLGGMDWDANRAVYNATLIEMGLAQIEKDVDPGDSNVIGQNARVTAPKDPLAPATQGAFSSGFSSGFRIKS